MTTAEEILQAVSFLIKEKGMNIFRRADIRKQICADKYRWDNNYNPTFQGVRVDQPSGARNVGEKFQEIFQRVNYGVHTLTEYGKEVIKNY